MPTTTLTSKGQTTIPMQLRELWDLKSGDMLDFVLKENGEVIVRPVKTDVTVLRGVLANPKRSPVSLDEMDRKVAKAFKRRFSK